MSVTIVSLTGEETPEQSKEIAWQMFCHAHPVEAYNYAPDRFWEYFHKRAPNISREQMVALLKEFENECPECGHALRKDTETYFFCTSCNKLFETEPCPPN